jgi:acyl-CoA dehydrogenase
MNIFGLNPVVKFGTDAQKQRMLPPLIAGKEKACFAVTEPNTGLNTTQLKTFARKEGDTYYVTGRKVWITTAQVTEKMLLLARTTPLDQVKKPTDGLSLFYTDLDRRYVDVREIEKLGRKAVDSNELFIENLPVPAADLIGKEGEGFRNILHGMNPERALAAAAAIGLGRVALKRAAAYANERIVFDRPIGKNQGVQHPLAKCWMELEAAKYLAGEAGFKACEQAILTHGGFGYAKEYHVERYFREAMLLRIAPISIQLIMCYIAEKVLGLPKSY